MLKKYRKKRPKNTVYVLRAVRGAANAVLKSTRCHQKGQQDRCWPVDCDDEAFSIQRNALRYILPPPDSENYDIVPPPPHGYHSSSATTSQSTDRRSKQHPTFAPSSTNRSSTTDQYPQKIKRTLQIPSSTATTTSTTTTTSAPSLLLCPRSMGGFLLLLVVTIWLLLYFVQMGQPLQKQLPPDRTIGVSHHHHGDDHSTTNSSGTKQQTNASRCWDDDDPIEWKDIPIKHNCTCPDPTQPASPRRNDSWWSHHHDVLVDDVAYSAERITQHEQYPLDVVLYGDSITEYWNRTVNRPVFDRFFGPTIYNTTNNISNAPLHGLALGTGGDICAELQWHLQNGILPRTTLQPKVFVVLIGTNDLGIYGCSKRTVLAGIWSVVQYIQQERPNASIVGHGLLPRSDGWSPSNKRQMDYTLKRYWSDIVWINTQLAQTIPTSSSSSSSLLSYLDCGDLFLQNVTHPDDTNNTTVIINKDLMPDALHPNTAGYEIWAPCIVNHVSKIIQQQV